MTDLQMTILESSEFIARTYTVNPAIYTCNQSVDHTILSLSTNEQVRKQASAIQKKAETMEKKQHQFCSKQILPTQCSYLLLPLQEKNGTSTDN